MDFGFSAGFFLNSPVEGELDLFVQRAVKVIPQVPRASLRVTLVPGSPAFALMTFTMFTTFTLSLA
jgi:hypothetical protein